MSNTKLPALPPHPAIRDGITWRDDERKAIDEYARAAILADRDRQAGEAVARVRTWTKNGEGHGELVDWLDGADALPDGEHDLYAATIASLPAPQAVQAGWKLLKDTTHDERSWSEDSAHENGCYSCCCMECGRMFTGHKRRVVCKSCADAPTPKPNTATRWLNVESAMEDPLFQQARAIMGTNTWFQDNALRNVINYVLSAPSPDGKAEQAEAPSESEAKELWDCLCRLTNLRIGHHVMSAADRPDADQWLCIQFNSFVEAEGMRKALKNWHEAARAKFKPDATQSTASPEQAEAPSSTQDDNMDDPNMHAYGDHLQNTVEDILRDVCELEPANPSLNDTVCIDISDLKIILDRHIVATQPTASNAGERERLLASLLEDAVNSFVSDTEGGEADEWVKASRAALATKPPAGEQKP